MAQRLTQVMVAVGMTCFAASNCGALDGPAERLRAEASWMDGVGKPKGSAAVQSASRSDLKDAVLAGAAAAPLPQVKPVSSPERGLEPPRPLRVRGFKGFDSGFIKAGGAVAGPVIDMASSYSDSEGSRKIAGYVLLVPALIVGLAVGLLGGVWGATVGVVPRER